MKIEANPHFFIGRVRSLVQMLDNPLWHMTPERLAEQLHVVVAEYDAAVAAEREAKEVA